MATLAPRQYVVAPLHARPAASSSTMIDDLEPTYRELLFAAIVALWFAMGMNALPGSEDWINTTGLIAYSIVLGWATYRQMKRNVASLWTPLIWYRVAMLSYFGIGSLVPIWTNEETRELMRGFYSFFGYETVKLNAVVTTFNLVFITATKLLFLSLRRKSIGSAFSTRKFIRPSNFSMIAFGSLCLVVGSTINYLVILPQIMGWMNLKLFSSVANFSVLSWLGYFMVIYWGLENKKPKFVIWSIVLALGEVGIGFCAMSKSVMLMPLVMIGIGFIYQRRSLTRIGIFIGTFVSLFMFISPVVTHVREVNGAYYGGAATVQDLPGMYMSYFDKNTETDQYSEVQTGWMRLSFVNAGTFVINQYDHGMPGSSYRYWAIVWIPRLIYPNKPIITDVGRELSYAANGNYNSSSSAGLAAEAYWNGGWLATVGIAIVLAFFHSLLSMYAYEVIQRGAWHLFFIILVAMRTAIRVDGTFVSDVLGPILLMILAHITLELMNRFLPQAMAGLRGRKTTLR